MPHPPTSPRSAGRACAFRRLGFALSTLTLVASCNGPQAPAPKPPVEQPEFAGNYGGGVLEFRLEAPNGGTSPLRLQATDLVFDAATNRVTVNVAIHNSGDQTRGGPRAVLLADFVPQDVLPVNATPLPCPACLACPCWPWAYDYRGRYGPDDRLSPGETSVPVEWVLFDAPAQSFSFRARVDAEEAAPAGTISGTVFVDANGDGHRQSAEIGIPGAMLTLRRGDSAISTATQGDGSYEFAVHEAGLYDVIYAPAVDCHPTTPPVRHAIIITRPDGTLSGVAGADFGCRSAGPVDSVSVAGTVFNDRNRDGVRDPDEPGLAGVLIDGSVPSCPTFAAIQTRTDANGDYMLNLPTCPPPYVVGREVLAGYFDTTPNPVVLLGLGPGGPPDPPVQPLRADFGVALVDSTEENTVEGFVYEDTNRSGDRDPGEPAIPNVTVWAGGLCATPVTGIAHTDTNGYYILRQSDVHCPLPWQVGHEPVAGRCDISPNPVLIGLDLRPDPRHYRVDIRVGLCDSVPPPRALRAGR